MEFVRTETETEALLLEANLIKRLRPRFNVLLRDDKSFPYILITTDHEAPAIFKHRGTRRRKGDYFGPFASATAVGRTITALQKAFLLRNCSDGFTPAAPGPACCTRSSAAPRPAPARSRIADYGELVEEASAFLSGKSQAKSSETLGARMKAAAEALDFERAAICATGSPPSPTSRATGHQSARRRGSRRLRHPPGGRADLRAGVLLPRRPELGQPRLFPARRHVARGRRSARSLPAQFYDDKPCPRLVLLSHEIEERELLAEALTPRAGHRVEVPCRSAARSGNWSSTPSHNAREALGRRLAESVVAGDACSKGWPRPSASKSRRAASRSTTTRHIMGTNAVGAMIVAGAEGFSKKHYRNFNIRSTGADARRRFRHDARGADPPLLPPRQGEPDRRRRERAAKPMATSRDGMPDWPDLVLIDGGLGQLNAVHAGARRNSASPTRGHCVGIAKGEDRDAGREKFFVAGRQPFMLPRARSGALLRPAPARRGPPLRHRHPPRAAQEGDGQEPARRDRRHRPDPQARAVATISARPRPSAAPRSPI